MIHPIFVIKENWGFGGADPFIVVDFIVCNALDLGTVHNVV